MTSVSQRGVAVTAQLTPGLWCLGLCSASGVILLFQDFLSQRDSQGCKWSVRHGKALISCHCSLWVIIRLLRIKIETPDMQKCSCQWST